MVGEPTSATVQLGGRTSAVSRAGRAMASVIVTHTASRLSALRRDAHNNGRSVIVVTVLQNPKGNRLGHWQGGYHPSLYRSIRWIPRSERDGNAQNRPINRYSRCVAVGELVAGDSQSHIRFSRQTYSNMPDQIR